MFCDKQTYRSVRFDLALKIKNRPTFLESAYIWFVHFLLIKSIFLFAIFLTFLEKQESNEDDNREYTYEEVKRFWSISSEGVEGKGAVKL